MNQPYLFRKGQSELFLMAGLRDGGHYVVLTRDSEGEVAEIHDLMPVLLSPVAARQWVSEGRIAEPRTRWRT